MKVREWTGRAKIRFTCGDCMDGLKAAGKNEWDLAIVDPPYGIGASEKNSTDKLQSIKSAARSASYGSQRWDDDTPPPEFFAEMCRASQKQVVWGANFFGLIGGMLFWDKEVTMPTYSRGELAWLSWRQGVDYFRFTWHGMIQGDMKNKELRIHPTQKPVALYRWLLASYAKAGDRILDTHGGSMSIALACWDAGHDLDAWEMDADYFGAACERIDRHVAQGQFDL